MSVLDVSLVRTLLRIEGQDIGLSDSYIEAKIPIKVTWVNNYCGQSWDNTEGSSNPLPGPVMDFIAKAIKFDSHEPGIRSESIGGLSSNYHTSYPQSMLDDLSSYMSDKKIRMRVVKGPVDDDEVE